MGQGRGLALTLLSSLLSEARRVALKRKDSRHFLLGAAALRSDGAIVSARNESSEVPYPPAHAEARLLRKAGLAPDLVLVVRIDRMGNLALARPCPYCEARLRSARAVEVWYSTKEGLERL